MAKGAIEQRANGRWSVRWRLKDGTHRRKTFTQKRDAERFLRQAVSDVERGVFPGAKRGETIGSLMVEWWSSVDGSVRPRTVERYDAHRRLILDRIGKQALDRVDFHFAQTFANSLREEGYAPRTVHGIYNVFSLVVKYGVNRGKLVPFNKPTLPKVEDPDLTIPTRDEVEALALAVDPRMMAMVIVAGYCGLREGELLALERRDLRMGEQRVWVHQAVNKTSRQVEPTKTKGSKRWVVLPQRAVEVLTEHLEEYPGDRVFPLSASVAQKTWERARRQCGLENVRFHDLRHHAASMYIAAGWNIMQVSRQLGHAKPSMTLNTYAFLFPESFDDALKKVDAYIAH